MGSSGIETSPIRMPSLARPSLGMSATVAAAPGRPHRFGYNAPLVWDEGEPPLDVTSSLDAVRRELLTARSKLEKLYKEEEDQKTENVPTSSDHNEQVSPQRVPHPGAAKMLADLRVKMERLLKEEEETEWERQRYAQALTLPFSHT